MMIFLTATELEKLKALNSQYDKIFLGAVLSHLKDMDKKTMGLVFDPIDQEEVPFMRSKLFLNCWILYFRVLNPLLLKMPRDERFSLIHLIFGNSVVKVVSLLNDWPSLANTTAKHYIVNKLETHRRAIKNGIKYTINHKTHYD